MTPTCLIAVRHGESTGNVAREAAEAERADVISIDQRDADVPLSARGEEQAAAVGRLLPVGGAVGHRIVIYRRPVESRARDAAEVSVIVREVVAEQVAALLNVPPSEIDL